MLKPQDVVGRAAVTIYFHEETAWDHYYACVPWWMMADGIFWKVSMSRSEMPFDLLERVLVNGWISPAGPNEAVA